MISDRLGGRALFALTCAAALTGCAPGGPRRPPMGPPEVGVVVIKTQPVTLSTVLPGRTDPYTVSDVRPQVNGVILARLFVEGANVRAGQPLYQIDPAPYRASYEQAEAQLASAQASLATSKVKAERYKDLVAVNGVSRQDYDDANASGLQAAASVAQAKAALLAAKINLDYTRIVAPISGRIGRSVYTKGALVTAGQTAALTTIQTLDPIYVDINQSATELLQLRRRLADGGMTSAGSGAAEVSLTLDDGSSYPLTGKLEFTDVTVDQTTGAVTLRALFPNPKGVLLPGMYVRAAVKQGSLPAAILAPQQGVTRDQTGAPIATVVDEKGLAQVRRLKTVGTYGDQWIIADGLKPGDRMIVEGLQKVKPGQPVRPTLITLSHVPATAP